MNVPVLAIVARRSRAPSPGLRPTSPQGEVFEKSALLLSASPWGEAAPVASRVRRPPGERQRP